MHHGGSGTSLGSGTGVLLTWLLDLPVWCGVPKLQV